MDVLPAYMSEHYVCAMSTNSRREDAGSSGMSFSSTMLSISPPIIVLRMRSLYPWFLMTISVC